MADWDRKDIRRRLSEYRPREGDGVYNAPYRATQADLNVFVIDANPRALQTLVDTQLNQCVEKNPSLLGSQQGLKFTSPEPWIVVIYASFQSLGSADETDRERGFLRAFEISFWMPIMKRQETAGVVTSEPAWFLPLLYTSPTAAAITGREVFGYPKVPAFIETPPDGGPPVGVRLNHPLPGSAAASPPNANSQIFRLTGLPDVSRSGRRVSLRQHPLLATVVNRFISNLPLIFRKQVRLLNYGGTLRAGYTALVEARVPISRLQSLEELDPATCRITELPPDVREALGIVAEEPLAAVAVRQCTLDIQEGSEIWVANGYAPYIAPLAAPGNDLIDKVNAFDIPRTSPTTSEMASETSEGSRAVPHVWGGVAEAYFCRAREKSINALLARHFPERLERPQLDPTRNFVLLLFLRGEKETGVNLYEFGVWVPVMHQGKHAWYVPYLFRSPGAAVLQAREWFGHPCQEGFIAFSDPTPTGEPPVRAISIQRPVARGTLGTEWLKRLALEFTPCDPPADSGKSDGLPATADDVRAMLREDQHLIALLQVRHVADTRQACVQEIVHSKITLQADVADKPLSYKVKLLTPMRLGALLDIEGHHQAVRGFRLEQLSAVWTPAALQWTGETP